MRLANIAPLLDADIQLLDGLCSNEERFDAGVTLLTEGEPPRPAFVLIAGLAYRYRILADGRRQILTFLLPGDFSDLHAFMLNVVDHSVITMTEVRVAFIEPYAVSDIAKNEPRVAAALSWSEMQEAAMLRERIVALGRRDAHGRVAYLLCELLWRYAAIGMGDQQTITFPLRQHELADALGLTSVHVNRVLQHFRSAGLIILEDRRLTISNLSRLREIAELTEDYLAFG
jgi:CRP-like cAMP-binding protein